MKISIESKGTSFAKMTSYLTRISSDSIFSVLNKYGPVGVAALASATPVDTGVTASSWTYKVEKKGGYWGIIWSNTNVVNGIPIAIILQYGHGTGTGGYVQGRDYINPAIQPIFEQIKEAVWREVARS